jgi:hypothetical protein
MSAQQSPAGTPDSMTGRKIGHYTITRRIGQGGMGVVYEAIHDKIKQRVAIKVLHKEMSKDDKVVQRFFNEANAISMAQHSSIVKIMDYGQIEDGTAYIMMEFLEGEPLLTRLERAQEQGTGLGLQMVVEIGRQTAAALALIHEKNIVHRDLKPEKVSTVEKLGQTSLSRWIGGGKFWLAKLDARRAGAARAWDRQSGRLGRARVGFHRKQTGSQRFPDRLKLSLGGIHGHWSFKCVCFLAAPVDQRTQDSLWEYLVCR